MKTQATPQVVYGMLLERNLIKAINSVKPSMSLEAQMNHSKKGAKLRNYVSLCEEIKEKGYSLDDCLNTNPDAKFYYSFLSEIIQNDSISQAIIGGYAKLN